MDIAPSGLEPTQDATDLSGSSESMIGFHPGLLSGLALANANRNFAPTTDGLNLDDSILTALEVAELDLSNTEMVVVSACDTGLAGRPEARGYWACSGPSKWQGPAQSSPASGKWTTRPLRN